ncbi:MAG TPA: RibD family protein [Candidatus Thermoplasmatota archaeon]|nr:RibD family protein [Candidatus Thermoplasmatota archaeon]
MRVLGNAAMSLDGRIALPGGGRARLSGPEDKARVHRLRHEADAIVVGVGTVLADDPELLVDPALAGVAQPRHPLRVVLDSRLRTPPRARVLQGPARTLVVVARGREQALANAEVAAAGEGRVDARAALALLAARGCGSVLVEGGARVHASFLAQGLYDAFTVYVAPVLLGSGAPSLVEGMAAKDMADALRLRLVATRPLGEGALLEFVPQGREAGLRGREAGLRGREAGP